HLQRMVARHHPGSCDHPHRAGAELGVFVRALGPGPRGPGHQTPHPNGRISMRTMWLEHERVEDEHVTGTAPLIRAQDLTIGFATDEGYAEVLRGVSLDVGKGESVGLVGESGSGKSVTCRAVLGTIDPGGRLMYGDV